MPLNEARFSGDNIDPLSKGSLIDDYGDVGVGDVGMGNDDAPLQELSIEDQKDYLKEMEVEITPYFDELSPSDRADYIKEAKISKYGLPQEGTTLSDAYIKDNIINETHADISALDRFAIKNFGNSLAGNIEYLQKKYPTLTFVDHDDEIFVKDGEKFFPIDPSGFDLGDIGDVAWDIGAGVVETGAAAAAGIAGGLSSGGIGALPSAMAASGATGTGLEYARQGIGSMLGINKDISHSQALITGGLSTAGAGLFGTGAATSKILNQAAKQGMKKKAAEQAIKAQRGLARRVLSRPGFNYAASFITLGKFKPKDMQMLYDSIEKIVDIRKARKKVEKYGEDAVEKDATKGLIDYGKSVDSISKGIGDAQKRMSKAWEISLEGSSASVKTSDVLAPLYERQTALHKRYREFDETAMRFPKGSDEYVNYKKMSKAAKDEVLDFRDRLDEYNLINVPKVVHGQELIRFRKNIKNLTKRKGKPDQKAYQDIVDGELKEGADMALDKINKTLSNHPVFGPIQRDYNEFKKARDILNKIVSDKSGMGFNKFLESLRKGLYQNEATQQSLALVKKRFGVDLEELASRTVLEKYFLTPSYLPKVRMPYFGEKGLGTAAYIAGLGLGGYQLGAAAGFGLPLAAGLLASPASISGMTRVGKFGANMYDKAIPGFAKDPLRRAPAYGTQSIPWSNLLNDDKRKK